MTDDRMYPGVRAQRWADAERLISTLRAADIPVPQPITRIAEAVEVCSTMPPGPSPSDVAQQVLDGALGGKLSAARVEALFADAGSQIATRDARGALSTAVSHDALRRIHAALNEPDGAGDQVLDAVRPRVQQATAVIAEARQTVDPHTPSDTLIESGTADQLLAMQRIRGALDELARLRTVFGLFGHIGVSSPPWPLWDTPAGLRLESIDTAALLCAADGRTAVDLSPVFRHPSGPAGAWLHIGPATVRTVTEARELARQLAEAAWANLNVQHHDAVNPYAPPGSEPQPPEKCLTATERAALEARERRARRNKHPGAY